MIGIFDSGIGGLTVVKELLRVAPDASFVYLGDTARYPYGNKSKETLERYALEDAAFLLSRGATSLVVACNTASALAIDALRAAHPRVPIYDVITPAVEDALVVAKKKIGVIGTRATIGSGVYQKRLSAPEAHPPWAETRDSRLAVVAQSCPLFVPLVEEGWLDDSETKRIVKHYLYPLRSQNVDTLILGCTHYPLLAPVIQRFMGNRTTLINSASSVVRRALAESEIERAGSQTYYLTDVSPHSVEIAAKWLGRKIQFESATLSS